MSEDETTTGEQRKRLAREAVRLVAITLGFDPDKPFYVNAVSNPDSGVCGGFALGTPRES